MINHTTKLKSSRIPLLLLLTLLSGRASADTPRPDAVMKPMLVATETSVDRYDANGKLLWTQEVKVARDVWQLDSGNVLFPYNNDPGVEGGVREVSPDGLTVWDFQVDGWVLCCQRLRDGNTLIGAAGKCALLIVTPDGRVVNEIKVKADKPHKHTLTMARQLASGNFLVVEEQLGYVCEYASDGTLVWEMKTPFRPFGVVRAKNGNTFISGQEGVVEVTPAKKIVWHLTKADVSEVGPRWFAGFQILPSGNLMIANPGGTVPVYEVNCRKQVVWRTSLTKEELGIGHGICVLGLDEPLLR